jgi:uncharacterized protein (TIGR02328 family)
MSCCNLRGKGWGKRNKNINYIYDDPHGEDALAVYHRLVLAEMGRRGYNFDPQWYDGAYCGKNRDLRKIDPEGYGIACWRNVPIKGHTPQFFKNDVETLKARGLPLALTRYVNVCEGDPYLVYVVTKGRERITYGIKL